MDVFSEMRLNLAAIMVISRAVAIGAGAVWKYIINLLKHYLSIVLRLGLRL